MVCEQHEYRRPITTLRKLMTNVEDESERKGQGTDEREFQVK